MGLLCWCVLHHFSRYNWLITSIIGSIQWYQKVRCMRNRVPKLFSYESPKGSRSFPRGFAQFVVTSKLSEKPSFFGGTIWNSARSSFHRSPTSPRSMPLSPALGILHTIMWVSPQFGAFFRIFHDLNHLTSQCFRICGNTTSHVPSWCRITTFWLHNVGMDVAIA